MDSPKSRRPLPISTRSDGSFFESLRGLRLRTSSRSDRSFLGQSLGSLPSLRSLRGITLRRSKSETSVDIIGPLGLNLLFEPCDPTFVDFVFVHGLRGGSRKTWSASPNPVHFWPKEWLPADPDFKNVRIHSFGYNSDWGERRENNLNIHDFGQSLIEEIQNCPSIRRDCETPIVLIGHSMGGLVIKKVCIIARENPAYHHIRERIHSAYFLATPHRGSDLAQILNRIMRVSLAGSRPFVSNLERGSEMIHILNDQFRHHYKGIQLHSFIESVSMNFGFGSGLVVDRESATLGYPEERVQALDADHRSICKFDTPEDPNFRTMRNRLASTVEDIVTNASKSTHQIRRDQMQAISAYLGVTPTYENELFSLEDSRQEGSCQWLTNKDSFRAWQFTDGSPRFFWLKGKPATGKSVLAGHVISHLEGKQRSYYFFKHGGHFNATLSRFFRSIAYQMAESNGSIREKLFKVSQEDGSYLGKDDYRNIWRKLFLGAIFRSKFDRPHYWVIDALDECGAAEKRDYENLFNLLSKIDLKIDLKIFITSRPSSDLGSLFSPLPVIAEQVTLEDSLQDIRLYVETHSEDLPVDEEVARRILIEKIVEKSSGCFLWTVLVMRQLLDVYSLEGAEKVLDEVPQEMESLYMRNLELISRNSTTKQLTKTILIWTLCAIRPLTVDELKNAIKLDIGYIVSRNLERSIPSLCGQLVYVDKHSRVQILHETARAFLTNPNTSSEFKVQKSNGHLQLALTCLRYLSSDEMTHSLKRRKPVGLTRDPQKSALAEYACMSFSEHISRSTSTSDVLFKELMTFLRTNVLSWVEYIAQGHNLDSLVRAAKHFKAYLSRRAKHTAPLQDDIASWATDLPRIVTEFGANLLSSPSAIHLLVAPFCPRNSIIYARFSTASNSIRLKGLSYPNWRDRISCIYYPEQMTRTISCRGQWFAVGLSNGRIYLYRTSTCEKVLFFNHGESVRILKFGTVMDILASAGLKSIKLWDVTTGSRLLNISLTTQPLTLAFLEEDMILMAATRSKEIVKWGTSDGSTASHQEWTNIASNESGDSAMSRTPSAVEISVENSIMAIIYRGIPVTLWCLESSQYLGSCIRPAEKHGNAAHAVISAVFNPDPDLPLLAVAYWDGDVVLFDAFHGVMRHSATVDAQTLACSPDGRTLAGGDSNGRIQLYDFETLQLLYQITQSDYSVTALTFTSSSLRLIDVRGPQVNVWEPSVLIRKDIDDGRSQPGESLPPPVEDAGITPYKEPARITTIRSCYSGTFVICGRSNGLVDVYDLNSPEQVFQQLYKHKGSTTEVSALDWLENRQIVASVDISSRFQVMKVSKSMSNVWEIKEQLLDEQIDVDEPINQILLSPDGTRLLVSTATNDFLWSLQDKQLVASHKTSARISWGWFKHPLKPSEVLLLDNSTIRFYNWSNLEMLSSPAGVQLVLGEGATFNLDGFVMAVYDRKLAVQLLFDSSGATTPSRNVDRIQIFNVDLSTLDSSQQSNLLRPCFPMRRMSNSPKLEIIVGTVVTANGGRLLLFVSESGWVCSIDMDGSVPYESFRRHFFVPSAWLSTSMKLIAEVTETGDVVFVHGDEIAVVQNGLEIVEILSL